MTQQYKDIGLFFFGSLISKEMMETVLGHSINKLIYHEAILSGYGLQKVKDENYPALFKNQDAKVNGDDEHVEMEITQTEKKGRPTPIPTKPPLPLFPREAGVADSGGLVSVEEGRKEMEDLVKNRPALFRTGGALSRKHGEIFLRMYTKPYLSNTLRLADFAVPFFQAFGEGGIPQPPKSHRESSFFGG